MPAPKSTTPPTRHSPANARLLDKLGLVNDVALCLHLPLRYEDETKITPIVDVHAGQTVQVEGEVVDAKLAYKPRRQLVVSLRDAGTYSESITLRFLHFYPNHQKLLAVGNRIRARGEARMGFGGLELVHPSFSQVQEGAALKTVLTPVYPTTAGVPQNYLRKAIASALARTHLAETVPAVLLPAKLPSVREALLELHSPGAEAELETLQDKSHPAWIRLKFEELVAQQLSHTQAKLARAKQRAPCFGAVQGPLALQLLEQLPFQLTGAQQRCVAEVIADLDSGRPMHRLLQGDVGSGKTVVAALAAAQCISAGFQCALMAPTEILAEQHFRKLLSWLEPLGLQVAWLTGSLKNKDKLQAQARIASGQTQIVVGTHAVITERVEFAKLGLVLVDEQHRFGVNQRLALRQKSQAFNAHQLMMTATPIPRTLAMTYFADLEVSVIDELPPGRTPISTKVLSDAKRAEVIERTYEQARAGAQVYWVVPLVEESEHMDLQNALAVHAELSAAMPELMIVLLHGRMTQAEKQASMSLFSGGQAAVMVATTVIEVGIDVPNASLMIVEHAERFGLSQLHQLRGRVGRGRAASACVLLYANPLGQTSRARLQAMRETGDGFVIAERDLEIRGPGELMGARQSGDALLRFADLKADNWLVPAARSAAECMLAEHPEAAAAHLNRWLASRERYLDA